MRVVPAAAAAAVLLAALAAAPGARGGGEACRQAAAAAAAPAPEEASLDRFLFFAVLEGLCEDGVPDAAVAKVLEKDGEGRLRNFVLSCPVCTPVVEGFLAYSVRDTFTFGRKGDPFPAPNPPEDGRTIAAGLAAEDLRARGAALQAFVERCVEARFRRLRLTPAEQAPWRDLLKQGMKKGMDALQRGASPGFAHDSCPSCDGGVGREWEAPTGGK